MPSNSMRMNSYVCKESKIYFPASYCRANQERQWRNILFTIVKQKNNIYTTWPYAIR